jgi:capsular exopolysaccharide synthesis family protein
MLNKFVRRKPRTQQTPPQGVVVIVDRSVDPHLVVYHDPKGMLAEQYRSFRTNLMALNRDRSRRALLFTSSVKGEGKSVTVANVALCLTEVTANKVVIVDADFRNPAQSALFGLGGGAGLSDLMLDGLSLERVVAPTKARNLFVVRAGREPKNPSELLSSDRMLNVLQALKAEFHYVLFDTPPVLPYTDASTLATRTEGVVFVVRMDRTPKSQIERAVKTLREAGGNIIGTFLAGIRPEESHLYYDYSYGSE